MLTIIVLTNNAKGKKAHKKESKTKSFYPKLKYALTSLMLKPLTMDANIPVKPTCWLLKAFSQSHD